MSQITEMLNHLIEQIPLHSQRYVFVVIGRKHIRHKGIDFFFLWQLNFGNLTVLNVLHAVNTVRSPFAVSFIEAFQVEVFVEVYHAYGDNLSPLVVILHLLFGIYLAVLKVYFSPVSDKTVYHIKIIDKVKAV